MKRNILSFKFEENSLGIETTTYGEKVTAK